MLSGVIVLQDWLKSICFNLSGGRNEEIFMDWEKIIDKSEEEVEIVSDKLLKKFF